ncbi:NAD(P)-binding protein [Zopfia rhizophila CBS 207.26]|uniref:NAD(P)-binding protein n=1 Tax=Zopfia rhizophila CBS 207.26 TaxID=1314779 RepID=A0A6A6E7P1_9PEZI|nr:NAD(P)-binding protein [Zopfia rhizophila CBS 207.26]
MAISDLTVIITGGAGGLGKTIAATFLQAGSKVAICDVNQQRLVQTASEWESLYAGRFITSGVDIMDEESVQEFMDAAVAKFGRLDILVNNAGIMDTFDTVGSTSKASWDRVIGVNLTGSFLTTKAAVNAMEKQSPQGGTVINIGSVASCKGVNAGLAYTVSKHGVLGLTRNTAGFYGDKGIFCIALMLGGMDDTNLSDSFASGRFNQDGMMRVGSVNPGYVPGKTNIPLTDVAKYCIFLADPAIAAASNGAGITVNKNWPPA